MPNNMRDSLRTQGYVLRRTNYGEADRILNIITPQGKISAIAKAARKEKSKLAGGIEMFSLIDINLHQGKSDLMTLTSAKMIDYYDNIVKDLNKMELASMILKKINAAAENVDNNELFEITKQALSELNNGVNMELVKAWFLLNLKKAIGEEVNFYRDTKGQILQSDLYYEWNVGESGFETKENGRFGENEIKMLRLIYSSKLGFVKKVKVDEKTQAVVFDFIKMVV